MPAIVKKSKKNSAKFVVDCAQPVEDKVFIVSDFHNFLNERIKVDNKAGNLGTKVAVTAASTKITVNAEFPFSKRYLKYLTKKYLKKQQLRDFLHVVATKKDTYALKYFKVSN